MSLGGWWDSKVRKGRKGCGSFQCRESTLFRGCSLWAGSNSLILFTSSFRLPLSDGLLPWRSWVAWSVSSELSRINHHWLIGLFMLAFVPLLALPTVMARYLVGILESRSPKGAFFGKHRPICFSTIATPHIGIPKYGEFDMYAESPSNSRLNGEFVFKRGLWMDGYTKETRTHLNTIIIMDDIHRHEILENSTCCRRTSVLSFGTTIVLHW